MVGPSERASHGPSDSIAEINGVTGAAGRRYGRWMITTHALLGQASTPVARGPLHSIRLRFRRPALGRLAS